jgi:hypothetical protein
MKSPRLSLLLLLIFVATALFALAGCGDDDDDDDNGSPDDDFPDDDDDVADDDDAVIDDDDDDNDDDDNDTVGPPVSPNPNAKADAFRLYYRERMERTALSYNRFGLAGDSVFGTTIGKYYVSKSGNEYEVVAGPNDNNPNGISTWGAWQLFQAIGGRDLELTLIRQFEGLVFSEAVTELGGITVREALPGWTRIMDGVSDTITRTRLGVPVASPMPYAPALEQEILDTFYDGLIFTYRENPNEYYWNFKAINELSDYADTFVFSPLPDTLFISNCCSSWMRTPYGDWEGAYWANHNSRDNFTDYAQGYLAAFEAERTPGLPADLAAAATNAANAARAVGDRIVADGMIQMTADEHHPYDEPRPAGETRPDGTTEWQDLGSMASCQMAYVAQAISSEGLTTPVPKIPLPGAIEASAIKALFDALGISLPAPKFNCTSLDDAFIGMGWGEILELKILGISWYTWAEFVSFFAPDLLNELLGGTQDDFKELVLGAVNICYYAKIMEEDDLFVEARATLNNLVEMMYRLNGLVYFMYTEPTIGQELARNYGPEHMASTLKGIDENLYTVATYSRMFGIESPLDHFANFNLGDSRAWWIESQLYKGDTTAWALKNDAEMQTEVMAGVARREQWIQDRYHARFGNDIPQRRNGNGYECMLPDGTWQATENPHHDWFGSIHLWHEAGLCNLSPETLDCSWAALGCAHADLNEDGDVNSSDLALFNDAFSEYGMGAECDATNDWCGGADLDMSGALDTDDQGYINTAQGCIQ